MGSETQTRNASSSLIKGQAMYITIRFLGVGITMDRKHNAKKTYPLLNFEKKRKQSLKEEEKIRCQVSGVTCCVSPVTCH